LGEPRFGCSAIPLLEPRVAAEGGRMGVLVMRLAPHPVGFALQGEGINLV
jgi:hypothetical protein